MNILLITPYIPYPLSEGGKISQYAVIDSLRKFHKLTLVLVANSAIEIGYIASLKSLLPEVNIETIVITINSSTNKLTYLKNTIKKLVSVNQKNIETKIPSEFDNPGSTSFPSVKSREFIEHLSKIILKNTYDLIQVEHDAFIDIGYLLPKDVKKVFVHHEIKFARLESALLSEKRGVFETYVLNFVKHSELNFLNQYDAVFVFSNIDKQKLVNAGIKSNVYSTPFPVLDNYFIPVTEENTKINKLIFIGGEEHAPNKDAVDWYINDIAPLVAQYSDIKLHVIGNWSETTIQKHNKNKSIFFSGFVDDIISYSRNSIMVVPVRIGSGIRTKILYAMAQGVPIISASIGCEGIAVKDNQSIIIANTSIEFSDSIKLLLNNPKLCYKLATEAQIVAESIYSQKAVTNLRNELFEQILLNPNNI